MQALCNTLSQQGYDSVGMNGVSAALATLEPGGFDLLLTDLMMPHSDGLTLVRAALERDPTIAVVMMTGDGSIDSAVEAMKAGALDYVLKPFKLSTLLPVLERALTLRRLRLDNAALHASVQAHAQELELANRELEAYAFSVSHDLRAPLRSLAGLTQLLAQRLPAPVSPEVNRLLQLIETSSNRSQRLVNDLLRLSRVGRQPLQRALVNMASLAREVIAEMQAEKTLPAAPVEAPHAPQTRFDDAMPNAQADPSLLRQVFVNLLSNAWKFTQGMPEPAIEVGWLATSSAYFVRDNGVGFESGSADKLFMPFSRLEGAQRFEGSGVGLSIVQRIVQRHGGRIWAEAAPGQGACFCFTLPPA